ncbi:MAG: ABC transporter permease [Saprospiraceae bacterium]|nr:ABC transporter permease [Saprospiraceae bacterium]
MNKLGLIIHKEYTTRVKNKKFILTTLLTPLGFLLFFIVIVFIFSHESDKIYKVAIVDQSGTQIKMPESNKRFVFTKSDLPLDSLKAQCRNAELDAVWLLPQFNGVDVKHYSTYYYTDQTLDIEMESKLNKYLTQSIRQHKIAQLNLNQEELDKLNTDILIDPEPVRDDVKDKSSYTSKIATVLGGIMGYIIFFIIFLYGAAVMRAVTEEKVNRIVEVIISSASSTELMLGKIIGVGLVGLTQIVIWLVLIPLIYIGVLYFAGFDQTQIQNMSTNMDSNAMEKMEDMQLIISELSNLNWVKIFFIFLLYFVGGYVIYAALFAAIGAAVGDDINDSQSLTMFVSIPIILAIYIMFQCIREPDSSLSMFSSMFPLFSPIVMPALLAFDPPWWQIGVSLLLLTFFSYFVVWIAARIFRTGILMYGKKASLKELSKWIFSKQ